MAVGDAAFCQVVGRKLKSDAVAREDADAVAAEFPRKMCEDGAVLIELDAEQSAGEFFNDGACDFNAVFFTHSPPRSDYTEVGSGFQPAADFPVGVYAVAGSPTAA